MVLGRRRPFDRAKDVLYIHDTLVTFGRSLEDLRRIWLESISESLHINAKRALRKALGQLSTPAFAAVQAASRVADETGRPLSPEEIAEVCRVGLAAVFG